MKIKSLLLAFVFAFATTAFAETVTILTENFNGLSTGRTTQVTPDKLPNLLSAASYVYGETQDYSKVAYPTRGLRFSNTSNYGSLTSVDFACEPNMPIRIAFKLASYVDEYKGVFEVTVGGQKFTPVPTTVAPNYTDYEIYLENGINASSFDIVMVVPSGTKSGYKSCVVIDDLVITQEILDPDVPAIQLDAPQGVVVSNLTHESATASWTAVTNAKEYSVILATGETETTNTVKTTSIDFTDLSAETAYSVKVAAVGNGTTHLTSDYSEAVPFATEAAPVGEWKVLFDEDFSETIGESSESGRTELVATTAPWVDWNLETPIYKAYAADGSIRISLKSDPGYVITTNLAFQTLLTRITASVKGYTGGSDVVENLVVTIGDTTPIPIPLTGLVTNSYTTYVYETSVTAGTKPVKISVSGGEDLRTMIDSFKIEQFVSASLTELPAPAGVTATPATCYSANIAWTAVTGADGYTVLLQEVDADGNNVGEAIVKTAGYTETSLLVDGLKDGASYTVSIVALGDGVTGLDSPAATASFETAVDTFKPAFSVTDINGAPTNAFTAPLTDPIVVNVSAMVGEEAAEVAVEGAPEGATFVDGVFTWTPMTEEVGTVVTLIFSVTNEGGTYTTSVTITVAEPLPLVVGGISASDITATGATLSWDAVSKATSYTYDIWYGSSIVTNGVDMETFFDFEGVSKGVIPFDVTIKGANGAYADSKDFDFEHNVIRFNGDTGYVITKLYPKAVTTLNAYFVKNSAGTEEGFTGNPVTVYASSDDGATWVQVASYAAADLAEAEVRVFEFDAALNYTRFKFEWQQVEMNFGISCIAATYTGAGVKMFAENQTTTDTSISIPKGLVANTEYIVRIKASNDAGDSAYKYFRFKTEKAMPGTVIILQ